MWCIRIPRNGEVRMVLMPPAHISNARSSLLNRYIWAVVSVRPAGVYVPHVEGGRLHEVLGAVRVLPRGVEVAGLVGREDRRDEARQAGGRLERRGHVGRSPAGGILQRKVVQRERVEHRDDLLDVPLFPDPDDQLVDAPHSRDGRPERLDVRLRQEDASLDLVEHGAGAHEDAVLR